MAPTPSRVLVLGGTGMLGHETVRVLADDFEVHSSARDVDRARRLGVGGALHELDAHNPRELGEVLAASGAEVAVNCIGIVKQLREASDPIPSVTVNALFPHQLAKACAEKGVRLLHVSTDCVFSGELEPPARYRESDPPDARDLYGRSKLLGEVEADNALTLRTSIIGWELDRSSGLLEWLASQAGGHVKGFARAIFSGLTTTALARLMSELIRDTPRLQGLYHVSSKPVSKLDLIAALNESLGLGCTIEPVPGPSVNRALDSSRFREETGMAIPSWSEMIAGLAKKGQHERQAG